MVAMMEGREGGEGGRGGRLSGVNEVMAAVGKAFKHYKQPPHRNTIAPPWLTRNMLAGLRSRCMIRRSCMCWIASQIWEKYRQITRSSKRASRSCAFRI